MDKMLSSAVLILAVLTAVARSVVPTNIYVDSSDKYTTNIRTFGLALDWAPPLRTSDFTPETDSCQMGCSNKMIDGHPEVVCQSSFSGYRVEVNNTVIGDPAPIDGEHHLECSNSTQGDDMGIECKGWNKGDKLRVRMTVPISIAPPVPPIVTCVHTFVFEGVHVVCSTTKHKIVGLSYLINAIPKGYVETSEVVIDWEQFHEMNNIVHVSVSLSNFRVYPYVFPVSPLCDVEVLTEYENHETEFVFHSRLLRSTHENNKIITVTVSLGTSWNPPPFTGGDFAVPKSVLVPGVNTLKLTYTIRCHGMVVDLDKTLEITVEKPPPPPPGECSVTCTGQFMENTFQAVCTPNKDSDPIHFLTYIINDGPSHKVIGSSFSTTDSEDMKEGQNVVGLTVTCQNKKETTSTLTFFIDPMVVVCEVNSTYCDFADGVNIICKTNREGSLIVSSKCAVDQETPKPCDLTNYFGFDELDKEKDYHWFSISLTDFIRTVAKSNVMFEDKFDIWCRATFDSAKEAEVSCEGTRTIPRVQYTVNQEPPKTGTLPFKVPLAPYIAKKENVDLTIKGWDDFERDATDTLHIDVTLFSAKPPAEIGEPDQ